MKKQSTKKKLKYTFTVDRKTWLRGEGSDDSKLLRESDGKMCCLGFACLQLGNVKKDSLKDVQVPVRIPGKERDKLLSTPLEFLISADNESCDIRLEMMTFNDVKGLSYKQREKQLKKLFAAKNIQIKFI
jgi:hypothetical protein